MVKRITKMVGFIAALATLAWAMRDRFISVTTAREPQLPSFRGGAPPRSTEPVDAIEGIGPVFAQRLTAAGIDSVGRLGTASPDAVAEAAGVSGARARAWIEQAKSRDTSHL